MRALRASPLFSLSVAEDAPPRSWLRRSTSAAHLGRCRCLVYHHNEGGAHLETDAAHKQRVAQGRPNGQAEVESFAELDLRGRV